MERGPRRVAAAPAATYADPVGDPRAVIDRLTAAQNAHDVDAMLACFDERTRGTAAVPSEASRGIDQVRAMVGAARSRPGLSRGGRQVGGRGRRGVRGRSTGPEPRRTARPLDERGVVILGIDDNRIAWARLYVDEVNREGTGIDAVVRRMAGTDDR